MEQGVPGFYFSLGGADPQKFAEAKAARTHLPSNHSALFAPDVDPALHTGIAAEVAVLRNLLTASPEELRKRLFEGSEFRKCRFGAYVAREKRVYELKGLAAFIQYSASISCNLLRYKRALQRE